MDLLILAGVLVLGVGLGLTAGWGLARAQSERAHGEERARLAAESASARASLEAERAAATEREAQLARADGRLREAFAALSADALRTNNQGVPRARQDLAPRVSRSRRRPDLEHRQQKIDDLVKPLAESLARVDATLQEAEKARTGSYSQLSEQLKTLAVTTTNLERALRTPNVRGGWGEVQLRRVVEMAGMVNHCHFVEKKGGNQRRGPIHPRPDHQAPGGAQHHRGREGPLHRLPGSRGGDHRDRADRQAPRPRPTASRAHRGSSAARSTGASSSRRRSSSSCSSPARGTSARPCSTTPV